MNIKNKISFATINLSVDTNEDLKKIRKIYNNTKKRDWISYVKTYQKLYK